MTFMKKRIMNKNFKYVWTNLKYGPHRQYLPEKREKLSLAQRENVLYFVGGK